MTRKIYEFKVQGIGRFPADMLRYDMAWPASGVDVDSIDSIMHPPEPRQYQVLLNSVREPTVARWASFGWTVLKCPIWKSGRMQESFFKVIA